MMITQSDWLTMLGVLAAMVFMLWLVSIVATKTGLAPESKRKFAHVATGLVSLSFPWLFSGPWPVIIMLIAALGFMMFLRAPVIANRRMSTVLHDVQRKSFGEFYLLLAIGFLIVRSIGVPVLYVLPLAIITLSDTASAIIGTKYGRTHFKGIVGQKSLEGSTAFFLVTIIVSLILLILMTDAPDWNIIIISFMVATYCSVIEGDSWKGLDNIFVPVGAHILLFQFLDSPPLEALVIFGLMIVVLAVMHFLAPALRMSKHAGRAYAALIIMMLAATPDHRASLPIIAIFAHMIARRTHPSQNLNRELEMIAVSATVAMIWLFLEDATSKTVIDLFNLSFAGAAIVFVTLASFGKRKILLAPLAAASIGFVYILEFQAQNTQVLWTFAPYYLFAVVLLLCVVTPLVLPRFFDRYRSVKAYSLAMAAPMTAFVAGALLT